MTNFKLQQLVEHISKTAFHQPFRHRASFNNRLKTTGGRYLLATHQLEFNPKMANLPVFEQIIKHELTHYHLHLAHKGYQHKDTDFKQLLSQVGGIRYAPDIGQRQKTQHLWHYQCEKGHDIFRHRRFQVGRYRCGQCGARLTLLGEVLNK
ncbi:SprT family protein [Leuconostoc falkenbergense]|uniref:SprT family protein n=1 Tax=Leuconostoc falkenbergense TaxID=2766470 RepID=UPI00166A1450|nr:SprT family protein [Leuconostoc falkenbergense]MCT4405250.1 SprT family protein [Leuconostoc falkenbergense]